MILDLIDIQPYGQDRMMATVEVTDDAGVMTRVAHIIPLDALEWRAAEYDIDPSGGTDTLLDLLLFEQHVQVPEHLHLYAATTVGEARTAILDAVKAKKDESDAERLRVKGSAKSKADKDNEVKAKQKMASMCVVDPAIIADKKELVGRNRERTKATPAAVPLADRGKAIKRDLEAMKSATHPNV